MKKKEILYIYTASKKERKNDTYAQRRLRSALASQQCDQSFRYPHEESLGPYLPIERTVEDSDQTVRMPMLIWVFAGRKDHFVGLVMRRLIYFRRTLYFRRLIYFRRECLS